MNIITEEIVESAELAMLGACMASADIATLAESILDPEDFYSVPHVEIFKAISDIAGNGDARCEPLIIRDWLHRQGKLVAVGGATKIGTIYDPLPNIDAGYALYWANIIKRGAAERSISTDVATLQDEGMDIEERASTVAERLSSLSVSGGGAVTAETLIDELRADRLLGIPEAIPTGFNDLDSILKIRPKNVVVLSATTGTGKTTLALQAAMNIAKTDRVLFVSLEMSKEELRSRALGMLTGYSIDAIAEPTKHIKGEDYLDRLKQAENHFQSLKLSIVDKSNMRISDISGEIKSCTGCKFVIIDYLGLLTPSKGDTREQEVSSMSRGIKCLAGSSDVPILLLHQLSRMSANDKREPELRDLRDSGAVENDANAVLFITGPLEAEIKRTNQSIKEGTLPPEVGMNRLAWRKILIKKQRMGRTGHVLADWNYKYARFENVRFDDNE